MTFYPGQLVVRNGWYDEPSGRTMKVSNYACPVVGCIYTIASVNVWPTWTAVTLEECDNRHLTMNGYEPGFDARGFSPITDDRLQIFRSLLNSTPEQRRQLEREAA